MIIIQIVSLLTSLYHALLYLQIPHITPPKFTIDLTNSTSTHVVIDCLPHNHSTSLTPAPI